VVEGRSQTVAAAVQEIGRYLIGQDPRRIEHHWQAIYRGQFYRGGPVLCSALSGIEQALWDITGQWLGQPVYQLLGGATRDKIRVYGWVGGESYGDYIESAKVSVSKGFTALKVGLLGAVNIVDSKAVVDENVRYFAGIREAVGPAVDVGIDFHGRVSPAMAVRLAKELEPYYPLFIEEPVLPENVDALATVARSTTIPIATGERLFTKWGFRELLEKQAAVILQPDISHAGGILECKKSRRWLNVIMGPLRRTARWDPSRWRPVCSWTPVSPTSWCRNTSQPAKVISKNRSRLWMAISRCPPSPAWASNSMRRRSRINTTMARGRRRVCGTKTAR
jgi:galactonate dehydratase